MLRPLRHMTACPDDSYVSCIATMTKFANFKSESDFIRNTVPLCDPCCRKKRGSGPRRALFQTLLGIIQLYVNTVLKCTLCPALRVFIELPKRNSSHLVLSNFTGKILIFYVQYPFSVYVSSRFLCT
jgi:hypothetical protein